jgi:hypothetical protein
MTIQQDIREKVGKVQKIAFLAWLVCFASIFVGEEYALLFIPGFLGFGGAIIYALYFICCPKCGAKLGQVAFQSKRLKFCPECGVDFSATAP